jgi:Tol biopolymer transport system component
MTRLGVARVLASVLVASAFFAATTAYANGLIVSEHAVSVVGSTASPRDAGFSDMYGSKIVYQDQNPDYDVFVYDAAKGGSSVAVASTDAHEQYPHIWGNYVVYYGASQNIYLQKLSGGSRIDLTPTVGKKDPQAAPTADIYGSRVVFSRWAAGNLDLYLYDISKRTTTRILSSSTDEMARAIWGDNIVYTTNKDVFVYNLKTKTKTALHGSAPNVTDYRERNNWPQICGDHVVYVASSGGNDQVFLYDLTSGTETQISTEATTHANPAINGTRIVYEEGDLSNPSLVLYDLHAKAVETTATNRWALGSGTKTQPSLWGDRLSWTDMRNGLFNSSDQWNAWRNDDLYTGVLAVPELSIVTPTVLPTTVAYSAVTTFVVDAEDPDGSDVDTATPIWLETSVNGLTWHSIAVTGTVDGKVTFVTPGLTRKTYIRFWYNGTTETPPAVSAAAVITPRADLGAPILPKLSHLRHTKSYSIHGFLKPRHSVGSTVRIYRWRKVSGKWKSYGYVSAKVSNYLDYSKYTKSMKLPVAGAWRLRALAPADSGHAKTWSSIVYVTVK